MVWTISGASLHAEALDCPEGPLTLLLLHPHFKDPEETAWGGTSSEERGRTRVPESQGKSNVQGQTMLQKLKHETG